MLYTIGTSRPPSIAISTASRTWGTTCSGVTKFTLWHPRRWSESIIEAISPAGAPSSAVGFTPWEMSKFWQNLHRRLQWEKKIVPEPFHPRRQSSSPKWGKWLETTAWRPVLHADHLPASRSTPQSRGHARQSASAPTARSTRARRSPAERAR